MAGALDGPDGAVALDVLIVGGRPSGASINAMTTAVPKLKPLWGLTRGLFVGDVSSGPGGH